MPNSFFGKDEDPVDALHKLANVMEFLIDLQGDESGGIDMEIHGKEGFQFILWAFKDSLPQIAENIENNKSLKTQPFSSNGGKTNNKSRILSKVRDMWRKIGQMT